MTHLDVDAADTIAPARFWPKWLVGAAAAQHEARTAASGNSIVRLSRLARARSEFRSESERCARIREPLPRASTDSSR